MPTVAEFVRKMLAGHSALGLALAAAMYLVCLSGALAVFYQEFERWEQPTAPEFVDYAPQSVALAAHAAVRAAPQRNAATDAVDDDAPLYIALPTAASPRMTVSLGEAGWIAAPDGSLEQPLRHDWTHFLLHLHIYLHLEGLVGLTLVGLAGVALFALIGSGVLAHPNILRDAFVLRIGGAPRLAQTDFHNRLSVWGLPFHLTIAITGAFIGLSSAVLFVVAGAFYDGDTDKAGEPLFGAAAPRDATPSPLPDLAAALANLHALAPDRTPTFIVVDHPGTAGQRVTINTEVPRRLVYAERYTFDAAGAPTGSLGLADGPLAKQIYASVYPLHFGDFGGLPVEIAYALLGFALCIVTATGVNIWLEKRRRARRPLHRLDAAWSGVVWGAPFAIALAALLAMTLAVPPTATFWGALVAAVAIATRDGDRATWSRRLRIACGVVSLAVPVAHAALFGTAAYRGGAFVVNALWLVLAAGVLGLPRLDAARQPRSSAASSDGSATSSLRAG